MSKGELLELAGIRRVFRQGNASLTVLDGADLTVHAGESVGLIAPSGTGKSTLLHIAGLLERPDGGAVRLDGADATALGDRARTCLRRHRLGFVYQFHHLLPEFTALENLVVPQLIAGGSRRAARERGADLLDRVGLAARKDHRPARLSGGEQQRVAIARALANGPALLLADEPTGNLDPATSEHVFATLLDLVGGQGMGALIATHNAQLADRLDRQLHLRDGRIVGGGTA